jgi:hypothetical protein
MKAKGFVVLSKRVLESNKALHTVYTKENKVGVTVVKVRRVSQM